MTSASSFERGWNKTNEPGLRVYVAADGAATGYFKGRIAGKVCSIRLDGDTITDWKREVRVLRGDEEAAAERSGSRTVRLGDYATGVYQERQEKRVGHPNSNKRRSRRAVENDAQRIEKFIVAHKLGRMKLGDIRIQHVREFAEGLYGLRKEDGKPYAQGTLADILRILGSIFREARKDKLVAHNLVRELDPEERPKRVVEKAKRYLTEAQVDALLAEVGPTFKPVMVVCAWAGLRISECLGLTWGDVDFAQRKLTIAAQLDSKVGLVDTKTDNSKATIPVLPEVIAALDEHRKTMAARGIQFIARDALVFVTDGRNGKPRPQSRRNALRALQNAADKLGLNVDADGRELKKVDIHSLRHSLITNGIERGMTIPQMALLARNTEKTMVAMYMRVAENRRDGLADTLGEALGR